MNDIEIHSSAAQEGTEFHKHVELALTAQSEVKGTVVAEIKKQVAKGSATKLEKVWLTKCGYPAMCVMVSGSHYCGYVGLPKNHVLDNKDYSEHIAVLGEDLENSIEVHGGVTFTGVPSALEKSALWWVGFDCAHGSDVTLMAFSHNFPDATFKDAGFVSQECEQLAQQLFDIQNSIITGYKEGLPHDKT